MEKNDFENFDFLEGYAAFTRDRPLAGRNLGRTAEDPEGMRLDTFVG